MKNIEAEKNVLAAIMFDPESLLTVADLIEPGDFYSDANRCIFNACLDVYQDGSPIDIVSIVERLKIRGESAKVDVNYLSAIAFSGFTSANIKYHSLIVKNASMLRRVTQWTQGVQNKIKSGVDDIPGFLGELEQGIIDIAGAIKDRKSPHAEDIYQELKNKWDKENEGFKVYIPVDSKLDMMIPRYNPGHLWIIGGYCFAKGTEIILYSGEKRKVEDLRIGDKLVPVFSSNPCTITALGQGKEQLYEISGRYIKPIIVNEGHILVLKWCGDGYKNLKKGEILNISVKDFLKKSKREQRGYRLIRIPAIFEEISLKEYLVPPYLLGLWLGDGTTKKPDITLHESEFEILNYLENYAEKNGYKLKIRRDMRLFHSKVLTVSIVGPKGGSLKRKSKSLTNKLRLIGVLEKKIIPQNYICGNIISRLELLAGLIDTDGSCSGITKSSYAFYNSNFSLIKQVEDLANSLGFNTSLKEKPQRVKHINGRRIIANQLWRLTISGKVDEIPLRIQRKKVLSDSKSNDLTFCVKPKGIDDYYGFELDGNKLFLAQDYIVHHNTSVGKSTFLAEQIVEAAEAKAKVLIFSLEDSREEKLIKLIANISSVSQRRLMTNQIKGKEENIRNAMKYISDWGVKIYEDVWSIDEIRLKIKKHKIQHGVDIVCLDYIQNIQGNGSLYERISDAIIRLQQIAKELQVTILVVSQVSNEAMKANSEIIGLKGAGELAATADIVLWLKRNKEEGKERWLTCEVRKNRPFGITGYVDLFFSENYTSISKRGI